MAKRAEVIPNRMEAEEPVQVFELPALTDEIGVEFIDSDSLEEVEEGIRSIERVDGMLRIVQGIGILKAESLWAQSGLSSLQAYREAANERYGMSRASVSNLRKVAYAWMDNVKMLRKVDLTGKAVHLLYLNEAIARYGDKRLVLEHFKADSARDFQAWARGQKALPAPALPDVELTVSKGWFYLDEKPLLAMEEELPAEERDFIGKVLKAAYRARRGDCLAHVVPVYDEGEARAVDNFLKKLRAGK